MPEKTKNNRRHFFLKNNASPLGFTAYRPKIPKKEIAFDISRDAHGQSLKAQVEELKQTAEYSKTVQQAFELESGIGLQIQFVSQPDIELAFQSLANDQKKIELLSLTNQNDRTIANVFVPDGKLAHFEKYIEEYISEHKDKNGQARDHSALLNTIDSIRAATLRALWTDDTDLLPENTTEPFWWEVWLPVRSAREDVVEDFKKIATYSGCTIGSRQVNFPERTVLLMYGSETQLSSSSLGFNCIAELRRAKETANTFDEMRVDEQGDWVTELLSRVSAPPASESIPRVCIIDSGVSRAHPALNPFIDTDDQHTVKEEWGVDDSINHGTGMAGLSLYGDLTAALETRNNIHVGHRLESVKLLPGHGENQGSPELHASLFSDAVTLPEITFPNRPRVYGTAISATDYRDRGRPSSWSAMVDSLAADALGEGANPRLFVVAAGNNRDLNSWSTYPDCITTSLIHDPGQAWNAVTVGACTRKTDIGDYKWAKPISLEGGLSPSTSSSETWDKAWPLKPDVVLEGGNGLIDKYGASNMAHLSLLTTNNRPLERLLATFNATSAASALCSRLAAQILETYPELRPETVRALIVHSAEWTSTMKDAYLPKNKISTKADFVRLIRHCGWGEPDLERALWSASNSLTLVSEDKLSPYRKDGGTIKTNKMNVHALPWPTKALEELHDTRVEMRVTLSYFIEPNPSTRGMTSKYFYPSHRLKFDVKRPLEASVEEFAARISSAIELPEDTIQVNARDSDWVLGEQYRYRGSLHQDIWVGTAADLASRGHLIVFPGNGWWRTRPGLKRYDSTANYSLIITIRTPESDVDIYNSILTEVLT